MAGFESFLAGLLGGVASTQQERRKSDRESKLLQLQALIAERAAGKQQTFAAGESKLDRAQRAQEFGVTSGQQASLIGQGAQKIQLQRDEFREARRQHGIENRMKEFSLENQLADMMGNQSFRSASLELDKQKLRSEAVDKSALRGLRRKQEAREADVFAHEKSQRGKVEDFTNKMRTITLQKEKLEKDYLVQRNATAGDVERQREALNKYNAQKRANDLEFDQVRIQSALTPKSSPLDREVAKIVASELSLGTTLDELRRGPLGQLIDKLVPATPDYTDAGAPVFQPRREATRVSPAPSKGVQGIYNELGIDPL